jgi:hypothetical protein
VVDVMLAELEVFHSRPIAPTRRVALGSSHLPVDPAPGFGGILLGGVVADNVRSIEPDLVPDLVRLTIELEQGLRIPQPRLRHRLQVDRVGLQRSRHRLLGDGEDLRFDLAESKADPAQHVLAAVYAAGRLDDRARPVVMAAIRKAIAWTRPVGPALIAALAGRGSGHPATVHALGDPVEWALDVLGFVNGDRRPGGAGPTRTEVQQRFRRLLMAAHPDHGGEEAEAARRIGELDEARRILLG